MPNIKLKKILEVLKADKDKKAETLKELLKLTNDGLSKAEFLKAFKKITEQVLRVEVKAIEKINKAIIELKDTQDTTLKATQGDLSDLTSQLTQLVDKALKEQENGLNFIKDKMIKIKDGKTPIKGIDYKDGKDADEKKVIKNVLKQVPDNTEEIDKLEKEIEETNKRIDTLKTKGGGGVSALGVAQAFKWIANTEKPVGLINGTNKVFTVSKTIFWVAGFTASNQQIAELPNFTYINKTITFDLAPPIEFATRDWEIKYIG